MGSAFGNPLLARPRVWRRPPIGRWIKGTFALIRMVLVIALMLLALSILSLVGRRQVARRIKPWHRS